MLTKCVAILTALAALHGADALAAGKQLRTTTSGANKKLDEAKAECQQQDYDPKTNPGKKMPDCQKCQSELDKWKEKIKSAAEKAYSTNDSLTSSATGAISGLSGLVTGQQQNSENGSSGIDALAKSAQEKLSANASGLSKEYKDCASQVKDACSGNLAEKDKKAGDDAAKACEEGEKGAEATAADKSGSGMDLGQLAQLASGFGQALGAMKKPEETPSSISEATPAPTETPKEVTLADSKISGPKGNATSVIKSVAAAGGDKPANETTALSPQVPGGASGLSLPGGPGPARELASAGGGSGPASSAATESGGAGAGGSSGSAASEILAATGNAVLPHELGEGDASAGGSGPRPVIGLKGRSDLLNFGEEGPPPSALGAAHDLGLGTAEESLASADSLAAEASTNLFVMVRSKITEIQKRGRL